MARHEGDAGPAGPLPLSARRGRGFARLVRVAHRHVRKPVLHERGVFSIEKKAFLRGAAWHETERSADVKKPFPPPWLWASCAPTGSRVPREPDAPCEYDP